MLDPQPVRQTSLAELRRLGVTLPPDWYPVCWDPGQSYGVRPVDELVARLLVLNVDINIGFRMPPEVGLAWIEANDLDHAVSPVERDRLDGGALDEPAVQSQVEAAWALLWLLGVVPALDPASYCGEDTAGLMPDLRIAEPVASWRDRTALRPRSTDDLASAADLHYCLTWAAAERNLTGRADTGDVEGYVYFERRRPLEWAFRVDDPDVPDEVGAAEAWDEVDLST